MESRIFNCVGDDDVEGLKLLLDYPNIFQIEDREGHTIFQRAIFLGKRKVFDFLLSLDGCPINVRNRRGETALDVALSLSLCHRYNSIAIDDYCYEDFTISLIKKDADFNYLPGKASVLHHALHSNCPRLAKFLIERGANLNCQDKKGQTPLHLVHKLKDSVVGNELLDMMLYLGADPSIPNKEGYSLIEFAFKCDFLSQSMQEHLVFYFFDDYCTDYEIPVDTLFELLGQDLPIVPQMLKYITSVNLDKNYFGSLDCFFSDLLIKLKPEYLKLLLEKFDYVIENIINDTLNYSWKNCYVKREKFENYQNLHLLFQSRFSSDIIKIINESGIRGIIDLVFTKISRDLIFSTELFDLIFVLLSYGANFYNQDMEYIYYVFSDCEFFRILLHMDIKISDKGLFGKRNIMPVLFYDIHFDIETFVNNLYCKFNYDARLLKYFAHPKLQSLCNKSNLPSVPLLVELARNQVRKFLIQKYKIENSMQFYTIVKHLPISTVHEKIITFETRLY